MSKFVSVIIPTYGGNSSLKRAVDSVLMQDYALYEVIVVDDNNPGSRQRLDTATIMSAYECDSRVIYICHEKNKNGSAARNTGAGVAHGEYFAFLDDDDIFLQGKLQKQAFYLDSHMQDDAVYCWRMENGKVVGSKMRGDLSAPLLDLTFTPCTCSLMIRREVYFDLNGFDESYCRYQDFEFLLRFFEKYSIGVVEEPLIEIIGNGVDNQPKGKKAIELKRKFLNTFSDNISKIDGEHKGYKKYVYAKHYGLLMVKLLRYGNFKLAIAIYFKDAYKGGIMFWKEFSLQMLLLVKKHIPIKWRENTQDE